MKFTILGASGFVGSNLVRELQKRGYAVNAPSRKDISDICNRKGGAHGHVIYCVGMTANFREMPHETVDAHICLLNKMLAECDYESFTYLSSTRVYSGSDNTREDADLHVNPNDRSDLYNLSKLMGESLALAVNSNTRVVRLSNVYGINCSISFLNDVLSQVIKTGHVTFRTSPESCKDFISIDDVVELLPNIALNGRDMIYNVASGKNTSNLDIANALSSMGYSYSFKMDSPTWSFPKVNTERICQEFGCAPLNLLDDIELLIQKMKV